MHLPDWKAQRFTLQIAYVHRVDSCLKKRRGKGGMYVTQASMLILYITSLIILNQYIVRLKIVHVDWPRYLIPQHICKGK